MTPPVVRNVAVALLLFNAGLSLPGCEVLTGPGTPDSITSLPRSLTSAEREAIASTNRFGFRLLQQLNSPDRNENVFISPLSASMALGMALNGADGETFEAMRETLGLSGMELSAINESYQGLIGLLQDLDPRVEFLIANAVFLQNDWPFLPAYKQRVQEAFQARIENVDFSDPATAELINQWVEEGTKGRIKDFVRPAQISQLVALLANTVYFKGDWRDQFDPAETAAGDFKLADGSTVSVPMMRQEMEVGLTGNPLFRAADLPYGGGAFSMTVLLPRREVSVDSVLRALDAERWDTLAAELERSRDARVVLPKFELRYDTLFNDALKEMGMGVAFDRNRANFSRMANGPRLFIDWVKQKSFLKVDEEGTEAAAATGVGIAISAPPEFRVDRPFMLAIRDRLSGTILFLGKVENPAGE